MHWGPVAVACSGLMVTSYPGEVECMPGTAVRTAERVHILYLHTPEPFEQTMYAHMLVPVWTLSNVSAITGGVFKHIAWSLYHLFFGYFPLSDGCEILCVKKIHKKTPLEWRIYPIVPADLFSKRQYWSLWSRGSSECISITTYGGTLVIWEWREFFTNITQHKACDTFSCIYNFFMDIVLINICFVKLWWWTLYGTYFYTLQSDCRVQVTDNYVMVYIQYNFLHQFVTI